MGTTKSNGATAPADAPRFAPFPDGVPRDLPVWSSLYLSTLAQTGGKTLSASAAGVTPRLVRQLEAGHPRFAEAASDALAFYADVLAKDLPGTSKPIGQIARLKSIRPEQYETALITQTFNQLNAYNIPAPPGVDKLMEKMLGDITPETRRLIALGEGGPGAVVWAGLSPEEQAAMRGDVIDVDPATGDMRALPSPAT